MIDLPPRGVGIEPATLWLRAAACKTTGLSPSLPPSGTQNTLWYKKMGGRGGGLHLGPTPKTQNLGFLVFDVGPRSEIGHPHWIRALALRAKILGAKSKWIF